MLLTHPIMVAALISFLAGSFGYVITVLVFRPLFLYHQVRRDIANALTALAPAASNLSGSAAFTALAVRLTEVYHKQLPKWYRLALSNRDERPLEAARELTRLAKTRDPQQAILRKAAIRAKLRLT